MSDDRSSAPDGAEDRRSPAPQSAVDRLVHETDGGVILHVHAQPGAGRSAIVGRHGDALKVKVAAPPVDGRANEALAELLARTFGVARAAVTLVSGASSRTKRFRLEGVDVATCHALLEPLVDGPAGGRERRRR